MSNPLLNIATAKSALHLFGQGGSTWGNLIGATDATLVNTPGHSVGSPGLQAGVGLDLDGISMHATAGTILDDLSGDSFTIIIQYIPRLSGELQEVIDSLSAGVGGIVMRQGPADTVTMTMRNGGTDHIKTTASAVNFNERNIIAMRHDTVANELKVYLNGTWSAAKATTVDVANGGTTYIGRRSAANSKHLDGQILSILLVASALTDAEVEIIRDIMLRQQTHWHLQPDIGLPVA